jgi:diguanylate cyclase (GGDEF)-like protein/PAS domain S-box-containing protein
MDLPLHLAPEGSEPAEPRPGESSDELQAWLCSVPEPLMILDEQGAILLANDAVFDVFGLSAESLIGQGIGTLLPEPIRAHHETLLRRRFARGLGPASRALEIPGVRADGTIIPLEMSFGELALGDGKRFTCLARDISHRKATESRLRESEERHSLALRGANDGLWDWDLRANRLVLSPRWAAMLGLPHDEIESEPSTWLDRVLPEDLPRLQADLRAHLEGRTGHFQNEHRMSHADGSVRWMLARGLAVWDPDGTPVRIAGSQTDVTEQKLAQERLRFEVLHDHLTRLPNRAFFIDRLRQALARARRRRQPFSLLYIDLDCFKQVNDNLGHPAGDDLLVEVSRRLQSCLGPHDSAARLGGDEFVVLADGDRRAAESLAERIQVALAAPLQLGAHEACSSASIGIACWKREYARPEEVMRDADIALYHAKAAGKARHAVHEPLMSGAPGEHAAEDLRRAMDEGQLKLLYQPVADLRSGKLVAFEALVRWQHPSRGVLRPADFLHAAEESPMAEPMAAWILDHACSQLAHWKRNSGGKPVVAINVSPKQLMNGRCFGELKAAMERNGLDPVSLSVEVSEAQLGRDLDALAKALDPFRELGVGLTLDHFGSGWSSFVALQRLPFSCVKLDPALLAGHRRPDGATTILRALARLAEDLELTAVAMGVENAAHLELVKSLGFPLAQGDYLAPAVPEMLAEDLWHGARR